MYDDIRGINVIHFTFNNGLAKKKKVNKRGHNKQEIERKSSKALNKLPHQQKNWHPISVIAMTRQTPDERQRKQRRQFASQIIDK